MNSFSSELWPNQAQLEQRKFLKNVQVFHIICLLTSGLWLHHWKLLTISFVSLVLGATTQNLPPGVLYRVKATYKYVQEDGDELSFDVGDLINVVEYEDPDDQVTIAVRLYRQVT